MANYPVPYQNNWGYSGVGQPIYTPQYPQQSMAMQQPAQQQAPVSTMGLKWVDGEVGAKAFQMPAGWPANTPIDLWDTNDTVIYLKSINPMGMPNPLQKARYKLEETRSGVAAQAYSGDLEKDSEYVKKEDMERMKQELMEAISNMNVGATGTTGANGVRKTNAKGE